MQHSYSEIMGGLSTIKKIAVIVSAATITTTAGALATASSYIAPFRKVFSKYETVYKDYNSGNFDPSICRGLPPPGGHNICGSTNHGRLYYGVMLNVTSSVAAYFFAKTAASTRSTWKKNYLGMRLTPLTSLYCS